MQTHQALARLGYDDLADQVCAQLVYQRLVDYYDRLAWAAASAHVYAGVDQDRTQLDTVLAAREIVVALDLSFFKDLGKKLKTSVARIANLFKLPRVVLALKTLLGEISVANFMKLVKQGADIAKKLASKVKDKAWFLIHTKDIPTLTSLVKNTEVGLRAKGLYEEKIEPAVHVIDRWMKKNIPTLGKVALAALFTFIWLNVEEISWEPADLIKGFLGLLSLPELVATLPESAAGFLLGQVLGGIGYTIAPYLLLARLAWMMGRGYVKWRAGKFESEVA
jgi:hypothetical protein